MRFLQYGTLYLGHKAMKALVKSGEILEEVEKAVGMLG
jgi:hypothetical protein